MFNICKNPDVQCMSEAGSLGRGDCLGVGGEGEGKVKADTQISGLATGCKEERSLRWAIWGKEQV